jgi:hypothetical protein
MRHRHPQRAASASELAFSIALGSSCCLSIWPCAQPSSRSRRACPPGREGRQVRPRSRAIAMPSSLASAKRSKLHEVSASSTASRRASSRAVAASAALVLGVRTQDAVRFGRESASSVSRAEQAVGVGRTSAATDSADQWRRSSSPTFQLRWALAGVENATRRAVGLSPHDSAVRLSASWPRRRKSARQRRPDCLLPWHAGCIEP